MKMVGYADLKTLIEMSDFKGVDAFIREGGDVNRMNRTQRTPLMHAVRFWYEGEEEIVIEKIDGKDYTSADDIIVLLINAGADVNPKVLYNGCTPLLLAVEYGVHSKVIYKLVDAGADVNARGGYMDKNVLMWSILIEYDKLLIEYLIEKGADVNYKDKYGYTPLFYALNVKDNLEIASILINAGSFVGTIYNGNDLYNLFLDLRCNGRCTKDYCERNKKVIDLLLNKGIDLKLTDNSGRSAVHCTSCNYLINLCVVSGITINTEDSSGWTPLMCAVSKGNVNKVKSLLFMFGADINCTNSELDTPLHLAAECDSDVIGELLLYFGSNLYAKNLYDETPLDREVSYYRNYGFRYIYHSTIEDSESTFVQINFESSEKKYHDLVLIKYYFLFINENDLSDHFRNHECLVQSTIRSFISDCKNELTKLKNTFLKDGLSFYNFCHLKQFRSSEFINISVDEFKYNTKQIKEMFPFYYNSIVIRMKHNQIEKNKKDLLRSVEKIIIQSLGFCGNVIQQVELIYDCKTLVACYLDEKDIYNLFLASVDY